MTTARKSRGKPAEMPREVNFLAIAREFRGNGNRNPATTTTRNLIRVSFRWPLNTNPLRVRYAIANDHCCIKRADARQIQNQHHYGCAPASASAASAVCLLRGMWHDGMIPFPLQGLFSIFTFAPSHPSSPHKLQYKYTVVVYCISHQKNQKMASSC